MKFCIINCYGQSLTFVLKFVRFTGWPQNRFRKQLRKTGRCLVLQHIFVVCKYSKPEVSNISLSILLLAPKLWKVVYRLRSWSLLSTEAPESWKSWILNFCVWNHKLNWIIYLNHKQQTNLKNSPWDDFKMSWKLLLLLGFASIISWFCSEISPLKSEFVVNLNTLGIPSWKLWKFSLQCLH